MTLFFSEVSMQLDALIDAKENLIGNVVGCRLSMALPLLFNASIQTLSFLFGGRGFIFPFGLLDQVGALTSNSSAQNYYKYAAHN